MSTPFVDDVLDRLAPLGVPLSRAMFGGFGIYLDGRYMAIIVDDALYLKADAELKPTFVGRGMEPFTYEMRGRPAQMSYYRVDAATLDRPEELLALARLSLEAAARSAKARTPRR